jgi:hypothetical protein
MPFAQTSAVTAASESSIVVPSVDGLKLSTVVVHFRRKGCPDLFDETTFGIPADPNRNVEQTSVHGFFTVRYDRGNLTIAGTSLLVGQ